MATNHTTTACCASVMVSCLTAALIIAGAATAAADGGARDLAQLERIEAYPPAIALESSRARTQIIVTGHFASGDVCDLTHRAKLNSDNPQVVVIDQTRVVPMGDGTTTIEIRVGSHAAKLPVTVSGQGQADPVRFKAEVLAVLTRHGCNAGSCHGAPEGKNGFRLSMLAYAPHADEESLIHGGLGRRTETIEPDESLLLKKPLLRVPHVGGKRLRTTDAGYRILRDWIFEGARPDPEGAPLCVGITVYPSPSRVLRLPEARQQLSALAKFSDGTVRDVTALASFDTSDKSRLTCDSSGLVLGAQRGVAAVTVRYLSHVQSVYFTIVEEVPDFAWNDPLENGYVDRLVNAKLRQLQYLPGETCDDSTFLRRVFLDLTGLLPGADRARAFLVDASPVKREKLIDELLASEEFARFQALQTADLMRVNSASLKEGRAELFAEWLCDSWRSNQPFDQFTQTILTATGDTKKSGPANYFLAIPNNEELAETTAQLFMGSRINCAKCHNHPFENWTQDDYYRIAAVFVRTKSKMGTISLDNVGEAKHPATGTAMRPWGSDEADESMPSNGDRREAFVRWLTQRGNPFFARVEVNRIWAHLFGRGIVHPVDDFRASNPPVNPELLDALATDFEQSGYDRRHIVRTICKSLTYQRSAAGNRFNTDEMTLFSHCVPRRLTAEQLHDAVGFATRTLALTATLEPERLAKKQEVETLVEKLPQEQAAWETAQREKLAAEPCWEGSWRYLAFQAKTSEEAVATAYPPESESGLDFARTYDEGKLKWQVRREWEDDKLIFTFDGKLGPHFLARKIYAVRAGKAVLSLGTSGGLKVRVNGNVVLDHPEVRALKEDDQRFEVDLCEGENTLLIKMLNTGGGLFGFYFDLVSFDGQPVGKFAVPDSVNIGLAALGLLTPRKKTERPAPEMIDVPVEVAELIAIPADRRSEADLESLISLQETTNPRLKSLRDRVQRLTYWLDYQTQRPYPEQSEFLRAFGQPKRETPCACERSGEPTINQALQTLNGELVRSRTAAGAEVYSRIDDDQLLLDEAYLSALARLPTDREREVALGFLKRASNRLDAVQDLLWALLNTREFMFQH